MNEVIHITRPTRAEPDEALEWRIRAEVQRARVDALEARLASERPQERRHDVKWVVGGILIGLAMIISVFWSVFDRVWADMMQRAAWDHEKTMAALDAVSSPSTESGGGDLLVGALIGVAVLCLLIGILKS